MKTITISCPNEFTDEQIEFIKKSALNQIEAEIKKELKVPQKDIDACNAKITAVKEAMGIEEVEKVVEDFKEI